MGRLLSDKYAAWKAEFEDRFQQLKKNEEELNRIFMFHPQLGQNLLVADLTAGDPVKVAAGGFADRHALGGKGSADVAEIAFVLRSSIFLGSQSSHIRVPPTT